MRLDDDQIERYSRQIVLAEVGPEGQVRLGSARVAVVGDGIAAERVVAYLAAAGVGWIAAAEPLHAAVDPALPGLTIVALGTAEGERLDAVVVTGATIDAVAACGAAWSARAGSLHWIAAGRAGGAPPCPRCGAAAFGVADTALELGALRDALLGTVVATEVVKALLAIGVPLAGRVLAYDPETAAVTSVAATARPDCACASSTSPTSPG